MLKNIASRIFKSNKKSDRAKDATKAAERERLARADPLDPLAILGRSQDSFGGSENPIKVHASDFPMYELLPLSDDEHGVKVPVPLNAAAMDAAKPKHYVMDDFTGYGTGFSGIGALGNEVANPAILSWYTSQSFIGWQSCALIAQHWLVDKACTMPGEDACRNGWTLKTKTGEDLSDEQAQLLKSLDMQYKLTENLTQYSRFKNIFGIRVAIFEIDSDDPKFYEKPFNIDGVTEGSYKGISQVDPYWMMPMLTTESTADPSSRHFYDPEYWVISGKKYHRSHLRIIRGPEPADILKPTYIFGGIPLTQRLYERVYAAERTANEAPLLSMSKRTTAIHVDLESMVSKQDEFEKRLAKWIAYRDNQAVKVLGTEESMEQFDISLSDFDSIIMNQFQLVAAIARTPATELLGTSPKGFNATGEFEMKSYNKFLVSIQTHEYTPFLDRHYELLAKSNGLNIDLSVIWNSTDTPTAAELADLNDKKSATAERYINMGAVSPDEVRNNLKDDDHSGFNHLSDEEAQTVPGASPENLAGEQEAGAKTEQGEAQTVAAGAKAEAAGATPRAAQAKAQAAVPGEAAPTDEGSNGQGEAPAPSRTGPLVPMTKEPGINTPQEGETARALASLATNPNVINGLAKFIDILGRLNDANLPDGVEPAGIGAGRTPGSVHRTVGPSVRSINDVTPQVAPEKLPKMRLKGMTLAIENARGSVRRGANLDGTVWEAKMKHHYGFIKGVTGADGDELDCFVGPNLQSDKVFVVNQNDPNTGEFDEHKCMLGFDDPESAKAGYMDSFNPGWSGFDSMLAMSLEDFKAWCASGDCSSPLNAACIGATNSFPMTDDAEFEEGKHPRAKNGQFAKGSGGGSSGESSSPAVKHGNKKNFLIGLAKSMIGENGKAPTPEEFHKAAVEAGVEINPKQSVKYLKMHLKSQKEGLEKSGKPDGEEAGAEASEPEPAAKAEAKPEAKTEASSAELSASGPKKHALPKLAHAMFAQSGKFPTAAEFHAKANELGVEISEVQSTKYLKMAMKEKAQPEAKTEAKSEAKTEAKPEANEISTEAFVNGGGYANASNAFADIASKSGLSHEGNFGGKTYYKAGNFKASYDPAADTWMISANGKPEFGTGIASLNSKLKEIQSAIESGKATEAAAATKAPVASAKKYGTQMSEDKFHFTSSGIASELGMPTGIQKSIHAYKGSTYQAINQAFRYTDAFDPNSVAPSIMAHLLNLQRAFAMVPPTKNDVDVGRKITVAALGEMAHNAGLSSLDDLQPGAVIHDPGVVSTSHSASAWSGDVRFEIKVPKGSKAIDISETIEHNQAEQEVLLPPNSRFKISAVNKNVSVKGGQYKYHIICEFIGQQ